MKINITKEWCIMMAKQEEGAEVSAGLTAADPVFVGEVASDDFIREESRLAFGCFVNLIRRGRGWPIEQLAEKADIEVGEIMSIEDDAHYFPEPRTVYQIANVFSVSQVRLMELSGLTKPKDIRFVNEAVRYAARSEPIKALSDAEQAALDGLISVINEKATK